jgi:hypothetical protein
VTSPGHHSDVAERRKAAALDTILDERERREHAEHDIDAWRSRAVFFEDFCKQLGWRLATADESDTPVMVRIETSDAGAPAEDEE